MAVQEISSAGSVTPTNQNYTSGAGTNSSSANNFNLQQFLQDTQNLSVPASTTPVQIDPYTGNINTDYFGHEDFPGAGWDYSLDPYIFEGMSQEGAKSGSNAAYESQSPGYQQFGQNWLNLLNTIGTQDLQWGGVNDPTYDFSHGLKGQGSVTPWDNENIVQPWSSGKQQQAYYNAVDFISKQTGMDPSSQEAQQLGGAYLEYTLQNQNRYDLNAGVHAARNAGDKGILGDVITGVEDLGAVVSTALGQPEIASAIALAQSGQDFSEGNDIGGALSLANAVGGGISGFSPPGSDLADVGQGIQLAGALSGIGEGAASGNPLEIVSSLPGAFSAGSGLYSNISPNTPGTNASGSSGITSSVANALDLTPDQLKTALGIGQAGATVAGTAVPLIQNALNAPSASSLPSAVPPPAAAAPAPPVGPPDQPGEPLGEEILANPSQSFYRQPAAWEGNPASLGGGLTMESMLTSLGSPLA